jgi:ATP-dependent DNA helicase RecQ
MNDQTQPVLPQLGLTLAAAPNLPPELRDQLLAYLQLWGVPEEQLELVTALRRVHGPLLFLLDYQAQALYRLGRYDEALEIIERRQRRSTSAITEMCEARALLAAGRRQHAAAVAAELSSSYPRQGGAIAAAAEVFTALGNYSAAETALRALLGFRPHDITGTLASIRLALASKGAEAASEQMQLLGAGIPAGIGDEELMQLRDIAAELHKRETEGAARLELERRRVRQWERLMATLAPFVDAESTLAADPEQFYRTHSGPEAVPLSREERNRIELETIRHFGFDRLRLGQAETIGSVLRGESILTVMPTGAGKSLCYQLPALVMPRTTLVISPLIALMKDQVKGLPAAARRKATFINSTLPDAELLARMAAVRQGEYKLVYAAPERLRQRGFLRALRTAGIDLFVVDEAHCVSMWGHDFRPDYLFIEDARRELGNPPALAMTATAPPRVRDEIVEYISGENENLPEGTLPLRPHVISLDIFRPNLHLSAIEFHNEDEKLDALLGFVAKIEGSGIIYVNSRHKAEMLALALRGAGVKAEAYHAGLSSDVEDSPATRLPGAELGGPKLRTDRSKSLREAVQDRFMSNETRVVVATIAFGMGIDKPDIRFIVHFHPSRSLDAYYQEVGRAGRDGQLSQGVLFYSNNDWANLRRWAKADEYNVNFLTRVYNAVATQLGITPPAGEGETSSEPADDDKEASAGATPGNSTTTAQPEHEIIPFAAADANPVAGAVDARRLQQVLNTDETAVRVAVSLLERADLLARGFDIPQEITITIPRRLPEAARADKAFSRLMKGLALGPEQSATFAAVDVARFLRLPLYDLEEQLLEWQSANWLELRGGRRAMFVELPPPPPDFRARLERLLTHAAAIAQRRIDDMIGYAAAETCRHGYISAHFGSPPRMRCDVCDTCTGVRPDIAVPERPPHVLPEDSDIEPMILDCLLSLPRPVGRSGLARILVGALRAPIGPDKARHFGALKGLDEGSVMAYIDDMLEEGRMRQYERQGYLVVAATLRGRAEAESWLAEHPEQNIYGEPLAGAEREAAELPTDEGEKYTELQKALWLWRRRVAEELGQPAYVVMSNEVMLGIAEARPASMEELAGLPGIGGQRLQHYGAAILDLVKLHPGHSGDAARLAAQRQAFETVNADAKATAGQIRQAAAGNNPQIERQLYMRLQELRQKRAVAERSKPYLIAGDALLREIARRMPGSVDELMQIQGFRSSGLTVDAVQIVTAIAALRPQPPDG